MSEDRAYSRDAQLDRSKTKGKKLTKSTRLSECANGHRFDPNLVKQCWCGARTKKG